MSYRRSPLEIYLDIIRNARMSINQTNLCTKSNINYVPFKKHATFLESKGFIMKIPPPPLTRKRGTNRVVKFHYIITNKGLKVLDQIAQEPLSELFDIMEEIS